MTVEWIKTSEELPEHYDRDIVFIVYDEAINRMSMYLGSYDGKMFWRSEFDYSEDQVLAWCYAPALSDWVEEE